MEISANSRLLVVIGDPVAHSLSPAMHNAACRALGLDRVLLTCDATNIGSRKVIEANGGVLENAILQPGHTEKTLRYWDRCHPGP